VAVRIKTKIAGVQLVLQHKNQESATMRNIAGFFCFVLFCFVFCNPVGFCYKK